MGAEAEVAVQTESVLGVPPPGHDLPRRGRMSLGPVPAGWMLDRVVRSHGWSGLPPSAYDQTRQRFHRTLALPDAGPLTVTVDATGAVSWGRVAGTKADRAGIRHQLRRMLCVDEDVSALYAACEKVPWMSWVPASGGGRLLRSPTVWEDLARMLATTNCSWSLTRAMVTRMVDRLGAVGPAGERAFPTREAVSAAGPTFFREEVRAGYRAESFIALARTDAPIESWLPSALSDAELLGEIQALRGFGPYAAQGMLGLLGRPRGLGIDSWVRAKLPQLVGKKSLTDKQIAARYAKLGEWAGWGLWLEMTRDWFDPESSANIGVRP